MKIKYNILLFSILFALLARNTFSQELKPFKKQNGMYVLVHMPDTLTFLSEAYDKIGTYKNGAYAVRFDKKWGYMDSLGHVIIPLIYQDVESWFCGYGGNYTSVEQNDKWGLIDRKGSQVYPFVSDDAIVFIDGISSVCINNKYGFIDKDLHWLLKPQFDEIFNTHDGFTSVAKHKKWGVIDSKGKMVIPMNYDFIYEFYYRMACVRQNKKYGYFNTKAELVVPIIYEEADAYFKDGKAKVKLKGRTFYIDESGKELN